MPEFRWERIGAHMVRHAAARARRAKRGRFPRERADSLPAPRRRLPADAVTAALARQAEDLGSCYVVVDGKVVSALSPGCLRLTVRCACCGDGGSSRRRSQRALRVRAFTRRAWEARPQRALRACAHVRCRRLTPPPSNPPAPLCACFPPQGKNVRIELIQYPKFNQQRCREELVFEYPNGTVVAFSQHVSAQRELAGGGLRRAE